MAIEAIRDGGELDYRLPRRGEIVRFPSTPEIAKRRNLEALKEQISTRKGLLQALESEATDEGRIVDILKIKAQDPNYSLRVHTLEPTYERMGATFLELVEPTDKSNQKPTVHSFSTGQLLTSDFYKKLVAINLQAKFQGEANL